MHASRTVRPRANLRLCGPPLVLLVGVLGAGKTTYLRELLKQLGERKIQAAAILNDHQNATIDAASIRPYCDDVTALSGSCVCCESSAGLVESLEASAPNGPRILETNGTTDPVSLRAMLMERGLADRWTITQVNVVDATRWRGTHWQSGLEYRQMEGADFIHLSRLDCVPNWRGKDLKAELRALAPLITPVRLAWHLADQCLARRWRVEADAQPPGSEGPEGRAVSHAHDPSMLAPGFTSVELQLPGYSGEAQIREWLESLPSSVQRVKGLVRIDRAGCKIGMFQKVGGTLAWNLLDSGADRKLKSRAVLIGPDLDAEELCRITEERLYPQKDARSSQTDVRRNPGRIRP